MQNVLMVCHSDKARALFGDVLSQCGVREVTQVGSAGEARRRMQQCDFDLCLINAPLPDEFGDRLACDMAERADAQVILVIRAEQEGEVAARVEDYGVLTVAKPVSRTVLWNAIKLADAAGRRISMLRRKNSQLIQKIEDIRLIDRAKCVLIEYLNMTEADAHRYIEKQAMDLRRSRRDVAETILKTYEG